MKANVAKSTVLGVLQELGFNNKLKAKTVRFDGRDDRAVVTILNWTPNPAASVIKAKIKEIAPHQILVIFDGPGIVG